MDTDLVEAESVLDGLAEEVWHVCLREEGGSVIYVGPADRKGNKLSINWHVGGKIRHITSGYLENRIRRTRDFACDLNVTGGDVVSMNIDIQFEE